MLPSSEVDLDLLVMNPPGAEAGRALHMITSHEQMEH